jgi:hypothetical protein
MHRHYLIFGSSFFPFFFFSKLNFSIVQLLLSILLSTYETFLLFVHVISYSSYAAICCQKWFFPPHLSMTPRFIRYPLPLSVELQKEKRKKESSSSSSSSTNDAVGPFFSDPPFLGYDLLFCFIFPIFCFQAFSFLEQDSGAARLAMYVCMRIPQKNCGQRKKEACRLKTKLKEAKEERGAIWKLGRCVVENKK